jgi:deoxyribodipyrimidine photo-lyase
MTPSIVWFRRDLRLQDNPALQAAIRHGGAVVPVYIHDEDGEGAWKTGGASRWWLHHSLAALDISLRARGSRLVLGRCDATKWLRDLARATGAGAVYWNRRYEPAVLARDRVRATNLTNAGVEVATCNGSLLHEPDAIANRQGGPYQVFSPYWRHCSTLPVEPPVRLPRSNFPAPDTWPESIGLEELELLPRVRWDAAFGAAWQPGEIGGANRLRQFLSRHIGGYDVARDHLAEEATSRLSPHLHFGEISPRQIWAGVRRLGQESGVFPPGNGAAVFLRELGWREFAHHLLVHFPKTPEDPLREEFSRFDWAPDPGGRRLRAWQQGRTGYPVVDAAMRQLWSIGWMHNRARMIAASFLVKHLRLPWQSGAAWFWDTLVDADLANNTLGWQWTAGCGADAAPYFRIFAPVRQGAKFDPQGDYVRRWVPELARLPANFIHAPWTAPELELAMAGVKLGDNYPHPLVDHSMARNEALAAFKKLRAVNILA